MVLKHFKKLKLFLSQPKNIVIVGHRNPDGDAIGSSLALMLYLNKKGHTNTIIMPNEFPEFLHWLPSCNTIYTFDRQNHQSKRAIQQSDIIFLMDFNALHRVGEEMQKTLETYQNNFSMIDHHHQPEDLATYLYSDTAMSSTCQMVYHFIEMMNDTSLIDKDIATCLYTGIMTDTGSFRFHSTTSKTHRVIANLIDKGAKSDIIYSNIYDTNSYERLLLLGLALHNLKILKKYKTAFITLTEEDKKRFHFKKGDSEGFVNYALSLKNIIFGVIFIEDAEQKIIKISFRSKGKFSVNQFSRNHFDGGGHHNAAGGKSKLSMEKTVEKFKTLLPQYEQELKLSYEN